LIAWITTSSAQTRPAQQGENPTTKSFADAVIETISNAAAISKRMSFSSSGGAMKCRVFRRGSINKIKQYLNIGTEIK
jgi:hypothetical protein